MTFSKALRTVIRDPVVRDLGPGFWSVNAILLTAGTMLALGLIFGTDCPSGEHHELLPTGKTTIVRCVSDSGKG